MKTLLFIRPNWKRAKKNALVNRGRIGLPLMAARRRGVLSLGVTNKEKNVTSLIVSRVVLVIVTSIATSVGGYLLAEQPAVHRALCAQKG